MKFRTRVIAVTTGVTLLAAAGISTMSAQSPDEPTPPAPIVETIPDDKTGLTNELTVDGDLNSTGTSIPDDEMTPIPGDFPKTLAPPISRIQTDVSLRASSMGWEMQVDSDVIFNSEFGEELDDTSKKVAEAMRMLEAPVGTCLVYHYAFDAGVLSLGTFLDHVHSGIAGYHCIGNQVFMDGKYITFVGHDASPYSVDFHQPFINKLVEKIDDHVENTYIGLHKRGFVDMEVDIVIDVVYLPSPLSLTAPIN